jgi:hypothetical protein
VKRIQAFQTIRSEGGLLPSDLLRRILDPKEKVSGTEPIEYGLPKGERLNEAITQSWNRLLRHWTEFRQAARDLAENEPGTGLTNEKWNMPILRELGFGMIPAGKSPEIDGRPYAINRFYGSTPVHLVGCGVQLDRRAFGVRGAAQANPHGMVQEFLNRSEPHLWAILSNGLRFRILRDNEALSRQAYLEFDLEAMFDGEVFADFVLFWLIAHSTRFVLREANQPQTCLLENWTKLADEQGARALESLRGGVEQALQVLGQGLVGHPRNTPLREALRSGNLTTIDFHGQLLRVVYRLIFLFVAEDREIEGQPLLHPRDDSEEARTARARYAAWYSTRRLRDLAARIKGTRHGDLWQQFNLLVGALSGADETASMRQSLALPPLGSMLWSPDSTALLGQAELANADFLDAIRYLAFTRSDKVLRPVDYRNIGAEEIGGIYESLLALTPQISGDGARFSFAEFAGNERKTSGSYYTPDSLVQCLLDTALDPVVNARLNLGDRKLTSSEQEKILLGIKICDPAVGSGHFLVGAAHRLAQRLAQIRARGEGDGEPSPLLYQQALRDVIGHSLYGVDINPMAAELCRVSLWMEAMEPGKPLSFLDHHIQVGNSLLGATPGLMARGIPDDAFKPIEGDDKKYCSAFKKQNKEEARDQKSEIQGSLFDRESLPWENLGNLSAAMLKFVNLPDATPADIRAKEQKYAELVRSGAYASNRQLADAWCAAFVWKKSKPEDGGFDYPITNDQFQRLERNPHDAPAWMRDEIRRLAGQYQFFHWHLAFPDVFQPLENIDAKDSKGWKGGFDVMLGNPPWERVKLQEKEWFAQRNPEIANAPNAAARKRMIKELEKEEPDLHKSFMEDLRKADGESHLLRDSGLYPLCGRGDVNLYTVFAELFRNRIASEGRFGAILPSGIATDDTTKFYFQDLVETRSLVSLFDFENKELLFRDVAPIVKFCLLTAGSGVQSAAGEAQFAFFCHSVEDLRDPDRRFTLSSDDVILLNPNTRTCPIFRSSADAELTKAIYRRVPVLIREARDGQPDENPWGIKFSTMFHMSNDSHLFRTREQLEELGYELQGAVFRKSGELEYLPLYESKLFHQFNHRSATFDGIPAEDRFKMKAGTNAVDTVSLKNPYFASLPRFWVQTNIVRENTAPAHWLFAFRGMGNVMTNSRNGIFCVLPFSGVGNSAPIILFRESRISLLSACLNSFGSDYVIRQKIPGGNLNYFLVYQFVCIDPSVESDAICAKDINARIIELTYTAWDLQPFARDCGYDGPPFRWDEERRFEIRCELDAAFFHLYLPATDQGTWKLALIAEGAVRDETEEELAALKTHFATPRDAVAYIMDTFPIVRSKDEKQHGRYRTKDRILEIYDAMAESQRTGQPYQTSLNPPPGHPSAAHYLCELEQDGGMPGADYNERMLRTALLGLMLNELGYRPHNAGERDYLDEIWGFLELTVGSAPKSNIQSTIADVIKSGKKSGVQPSEFGKALVLEKFDANRAWPIIESALAVS